MKNQFVMLAGMTLLALLCIVGICAAQTGNNKINIPNITVPDASSLSNRSERGGISADEFNFTQTIDNTNGEQVTEVSDDIQPYNGTIGADSTLYGLKITMENLDETFTFNETERLEKRISHANLRIAEVKKELLDNRTDYAERALEEYRQKLNLTETTLTSYASNTTGLLHAEEMIAKHQVILENLLHFHPNNTGLAQAYNNSLTLEQKFEQKTAIKYNRTVSTDNRVILKPMRLELHNQTETNVTFVPNHTTMQHRLTEFVPSVTETPQKSLTPSKEHEG